MKLAISLVTILVATGINLCLCDEIKTDEGVLVLTKSTYDQALADNEFVLVEFCKFSIQL